MRMPATPKPPPARPTGRPLRPPPPPPAPRASITSCDPPPRFQRMAGGAYGLTKRSAAFALARRQPALGAGAGLALEPPRVGRVLEGLGDRRRGPAGKPPPQDPAADEDQGQHADDD